MQHLFNYLQVLLLLSLTSLVLASDYISYPSLNLQAAPLSSANLQSAITSISEDKSIYFDIILRNVCMSDTQLTHILHAILRSPVKRLFINGLMKRNAADGIFLQTKILSYMVLNPAKNYDKEIIFIYRASTPSAKLETHLMYVSSQKNYRIVVALFEEYEFNILNAEASDIEKDAFLAVWVALKKMGGGFRLNIVRLNSIRAEFMTYCMMRRMWEDIITMLDVIGNEIWTREIGKTIILSFGCTASLPLLMKVLEVDGYDLSMLKLAKNICKRDTDNEMMLSAYYLMKTVELESWEKDA